jgi:radical SAM protein with 4Fe4S-binding SPASM domain
MEAAIITTYRCMNRCHMCNIWRHPTTEAEEFRPDLLDRLPRLGFANITGGEPFLREDIEELVAITLRKAQRVVISTNGFLTDRIIDVARKFRHRKLGIRVSLEGLPAANDELRGIKDCFDHGLRTLLELRRLGFKDIGFGITVSDRNARDMIELYELAKSMKVEFATAAVHNSYYFHKFDNTIEKTDEVVSAFREITRELLATKRVKNWYRAYFNHGLMNYVRGKPRLLPCPAGTDMFFLDPSGEIYPCNGLEETVWCASLGNLHRQEFEEIWKSEKAREVREKVRNCPKNCWMIGTVAPVMKTHLWRPTAWIISHKFLKRPL